MPRPARARSFTSADGYPALGRPNGNRLTALLTSRRWVGRVGEHDELLPLATAQKVPNAGQGAGDPRMAGDAVDAHDRIDDITRVLEQGHHGRLRENADMGAVQDPGIGAVPTAAQELKTTGA